MTDRTNHRALAGAGHWSDPTPAGEVCRCLCHESGPALEHLGGGKCPCRTSGAINPNLATTPPKESTHD